MNNRKLSPSTNQKDIQKEETETLKEGMYLVVNNAFVRVKTGYEQMIATLQKGEVAMPFLNGGEKYTFHG